jgi:hypothetical protein
MANDRPIRESGTTRRGGFLAVAAGAVLVLTAAPAAGAADDGPVPLARGGVAQPADATAAAPGTLSPAAHRALTRGPLPAGADDLAAKAAADAAAVRAADGAEPGDRAAAGEPSAARARPTILPPGDFAGQLDRTVTPSDSTGAVGPTRYVQLINRRFGIYPKGAVTPIASGTLTTLAGVPAEVNAFDPQVIWDPTTDRFYYAMDGVFAFDDNRLLYGFSKTANPTSAADFCKYTIAYGAEFPDYPKLGDTREFIVIGSNVFTAAFVRSDLAVLPKPGPGAACPPGPPVFFKRGLRDADGALVFTPVPANQIDTSPRSYVVARNFGLPSTRLWLFYLSRSTTGTPVSNRLARPVSVAGYGVPPNAAQPGNLKLLDTLDARPTQAILSRNPRQGDAFSLWTQHTIAAGNAAGVRWYEIRPEAPAAVLRSTTLAAPGNFLFNAAISSDRRVDGTVAAFGDSFVIGYNVSSRLDNIRPRVVMASSVDGGGLAFRLVEDGAAPYVDFTCAVPGEAVCRWGDYAGATPDPRPPTGNAGAVWLTNQFSGVANPPTDLANWRTRIWAARP